MKTAFGLIAVLLLASPCAVHAADKEFTETIQLPECHSNDWICRNTPVKNTKWWRDFDFKLTDEQWREAVKEMGEGKSEDVKFDLWVPEGVDVVKGIVVISSWGSGGHLYLRPDLRALGRELHLALFNFAGMPMHHGFQPTSLLFERLKAFGEKSGHPELANAPLFLYGHSNGTGFSALFAGREAPRVWGWVSMRPGYTYQVYQPRAAQVPGLVIFGEDDEFFARPSQKENLAIIPTGRKKLDAQWNVVVEPKGGHFPCERTWPLVFSFLRHTFNDRVPADADPRKGLVKLNTLATESGYLGQNWDLAKGDGQVLPIAPCAQFNGDKTAASWLVNASYAADWQAFQREIPPPSNKPNTPAKPSGSPGPSSSTNHQGVWQWSVSTDNKQGRAFLWIPPGCDYVRGIILGQHTCLESVLLEDPIVRTAAARQNLATVFFSPGPFTPVFTYETFRSGGDGMARLDKILARLADVSGYAELRQAPICHIGNSFKAVSAWDFACRQPKRCFAMIGVHAAPDAGVHPGDPRYWEVTQGVPPASTDFVPILFISGQYESYGEVERTIEWHWRWCRGALLCHRAVDKFSYMSLVVGPGFTHFGLDEAQTRYSAMFIEKAAQRRIPHERPAEGQFPRLIDLPKNSGWLADITFTTPSRIPPAPYDEFRGDPTMAMWHLDGELARSNEAIATSAIGKKLQLVTFAQDGKAAPNARLPELPFEPDADGVSFRVQAEFITRAPAQMGFPGVKEIGHADGPILFSSFPANGVGVEQISADRFRIAMNRFSYANGGGDGVMLLAYHPGNHDYVYTEKPVCFKAPYRHTEGKPQKIVFPEIPALSIAVGEHELKAACDSGRAVRYFVISGPVVIKDGRVKIVPGLIPPRSRFPLRAEVAAYEWGSAVEPRFQSAETVVRAFSIEKGAGSKQAGN